MEYPITIVDLACGEDDVRRIICVTAEGQTRTHADLLLRVDAWQVAFSASAKEQWAIYCTDPFEFAAALLGAWHANRVQRPLPHLLDSLCGPTWLAFQSFAAALQATLQSCLGPDAAVLGQPPRSGC